MERRIIKSSYGKNIRLTIYGGSHEEEIGVILEKFPLTAEDLKDIIDFNRVQSMLDRRAPGNSRFATSRKEKDKFFLKADKPLTFAIRNTNIRSSDYNLDLPRPGHSDFPAHFKYKGQVNMAGGGPFSGRMTAPLVIAGAIAVQLLEKQGITLGSRIYSIGDICDEEEKGSISPEYLEFKDPLFPCYSERAIVKMKAAIDACREEKDSLGGIVEFWAKGVKIGTGGPIFQGIEGSLSSWFFAIPAAKGLEFGSGFKGTTLKGSENNDSFPLTTNNAGGILGGMADGAPIVGRVAFKPTPSIGKPQKTINFTTGKEEILEIKGRHDPCIVPRAVPVVEAALALGLLDIILEEGDLQWL